MYNENEYRIFKINTESANMKSLYVLHFKLHIKLNSYERVY